MNIFLIGYRCTGKTTVGECIARQLDWDFVDADKMMMAESGKTVAQIVSRGGWPLFRRMEKQTLKRICKGDRQVVATGGGVVLDAENVALMKKNGVVVWLQADPETIYERMIGDQQTGDLRPPLTDQALLVEIEETLKERTPLYGNANTIEVNTAGKRIEKICSEILTFLSLDISRNRI